MLSVRPSELPRIFLFNAVSLSRAAWPCYGYNIWMFGDRQVGNKYVNDHALSTFPSTCSLSHHYPRPLGIIMVMSH